MKKYGIFFLVMSLMSFMALGQEKLFFKRGSERLEKKDFVNAAKDFAYVLQFNPQNDAAYFNRGFAYQQLGKHAEAVSDFSSAIDLRADNPDAYLHRSISKLGGK